MLFKKLFDNIKRLIKWLISWFKPQFQGLANPTLISVKEITSMSKEPDVMIYTYNLGPYDGDTEIRQVTINVADVNETKIVNVSVEDNTIEVRGFEDAKATLTVVDIDNKGNKAPPVVHDIVLLDTVSPLPGSVLTVISVSEIPGKKIVPKVEEPVVEEPKVEEPVVEEPKVEEPVAEEPKVEEPKVEEPKVEEPKVEEPKVEEPKVEEPKVEEPVAEEPKVEEPVVEEPKVEEPVAEEPKVEEPVVPAKAKSKKKKE